MTAIEIVLWSAAALVAYAYFGYPVLLLSWLPWRRRIVRRPGTTPAVSIVITVHNGAGVMAAKIANTLALRYPADRMEILVASDGSTDETNAVVRGLSDDRVRLVELPNRLGKEGAQREAIARARGDILLFTDAGVQAASDAVENMVASFSDSSVGCVSGVDRVLDASGRAQGEGAFVRYETRLKLLESEIGSTVGNSGWLFAVRRELCDEWPSDMASDFTMALRAVRRGLRCIVDPRVVAVATASASERREFDRKVRTIARGMVVLGAHRDLLNPLRYGRFAVQLLSHKLLRWCLPFLLATLLVASAALAIGSIPYRALLAVQVAFYASGVVWPGARLPRFFVISSAATLVAWWKVVCGERFVTWDPTPRTLGIE